MHAAVAERQGRRGIPWGWLVPLLALCVAPIGAMVVISSMLDRDCKVLSASEGEARPNLMWRIEVLRCGTGPEVTNVLVARTHAAS